MTDFIKQAKEYFEQNPDQDVFCVTNPDTPKHFKSITKVDTENYEKIKNMFIDIAIANEEDWSILNSPNHE